MATERIDSPSYEPESWRLSFGAVGACELLVVHHAKSQLSRHNCCLGRAKYRSISGKTGEVLSSPTYRALQTIKLAQLVQHDPT